MLLLILNKIQEEKQSLGEFSEEILRARDYKNKTYTCQYGFIFDYQLDLIEILHGSKLSGSYFKIQCPPLI